MLNELWEKDVFTQTVIVNVPKVWRSPPMLDAFCEKDLIELGMLCRWGLEVVEKRDGAVREVSGCGTCRENEWFPAHLE